MLPQYELFGDIQYDEMHVIKDKMEQDKRNNQKEQQESEGSYISSAMEIIADAKKEFEENTKSPNKSERINNIRGNKKQERNRYRPDEIFSFQNDKDENMKDNELEQSEEMTPKEKQQLDFLFKKNEGEE